MSKFINIPTTVTGQPNILFNADNVVAVIPPPVTIVPMAAGSSSTTTITVTSTTGLLPGMTVFVTAGVGAFAALTTVVSVNVNGTTFVVSATPTTTLSGATISAAFTYCTLCTHNKLFRLNFSGATPTIQNDNAEQGAAQIERALLGTYSGPNQFNVAFNVGSINSIVVV
jgi:hypothetical protein